MTTLNHQTNEALDRMLSEALGWKFSQRAPGYLAVFSPDGHYRGGASSYESNQQEKAMQNAGVPRYTQSLDECAGVEAGLTEEQWREYLPRLEDLSLADLPNIMPDWQRKLNPSRIIDAALILARPKIRTIALIQTLQSTP